MSLERYWTSRMREKHATLEFTRDRKSMSVLCTDEDAAMVLYVKGAPESILERCSRILTPSGVEVLTEAGREAVGQKLSELGAEALRPLALAFKEGRPL